MADECAADVRVFLGQLGSGCREVVEALREVVLRTAPGVEEQILWGGLSYHRPWVGGAVKGALCQIVTRGPAVRLDFIHGVKLPDPEGILKGRQKSKRFVAVGSVAEARRPAIAALVREASLVEWEEKPPRTPRARREEGEGTARR